MNLQLVLIILLFMSAYFFNKMQNKDKSRRNFIFFGSGLLIFSAALRSLDYGAEGSDTMNYYNMYSTIGDSSFSDIWKLAIARYIGGSSEEDIGFLFLEKIISLVTTDFHIFTFIAQLLFYVPFGICLYRYSRSILDLLFAFVFFIPLGFPHAMTGTRQFYALGFGVLFFLLCNDQKYKYAIVALLLGMSIHLSLLLVVIPFALSCLKPRQLRTVHIILFLLFPFVMMFPNQVIMYMGNIIGSEKYAAYGMNTAVGGTETFIFLLEFLSLVCLLGIKRVQLQEPITKALYAMVPCFTFFGPLIYSNGSMIRISMYSYIYLTLLLPIALQGLFKDSRTVMFVFIAVLSFLILKGGGQEYYFFWEKDPISSW